jgi:hypothetical protein
MPFASWRDVLEWAASGRPLFYKAPLDHKTVRLWQGKPSATGAFYEVRPRTIRIFPPGSTARGKYRTADPFTADAGHLDRFLRPVPPVEEDHAIGFSDGLDATIRGKTP